MNRGGGQVQNTDYVLIQGTHMPILHLNFKVPVQIRCVSATDCLCGIQVGVTFNTETLLLVGVSELPLLNRTTCFECIL